MPSPFARLCQARIVVIAIVVVLTGVASAAFASADRTAVAQTDENTYVNPTYGYQLEWDPEIWSVVEDGPGDLALESELVEAYFQSGQFYGGDATACRDDLIDRLPEDDTVVSSEPFEGDDELSGEADGRAFATLQVDLAESDGQDARTVAERIDCRTVVAGEAVLAITWLAPIDDADAAIATADSLLDALVIPSFQGPGAEVAGLDGGSYVDPELGYGLSWDDSVWTSFVPVDAVFGLNSTTSLISFSLPDDFGGDPAQCVEQTLDDLSSSPGIVDVSPIERDGESIAGLDDAGWSYAAIDANYGGTEQFVEIRCATIPEAGLTLRAVHSGPVDSYENEAELAAPVFASLTIEGDPGNGTEVDATPAAPEEPLPGATPSAAAATPVPAEPAGTPEPEGDPAVDGDRDFFTSVAGNWSIAYDVSIWQLLDPALYATVELALGGESSVVTFDTAPADGGEVQEILDSIVETEIVASAGDDQNVEELEAPPLPSNGAVGAAYGYQTAGGADAALGIVVIPLGSDQVVVVRIYTSPAAYSDAFDGLEDLLNSVAQ